MKYYKNRTKYVNYYSADKEFLKVLKLVKKTDKIKEKTFYLLKKYNQSLVIHLNQLLHFENWHISLKKLDLLKSLF